MKLTIREYIYALIAMALAVLIAWLIIMFASDTGAQTRLPHQELLYQGIPLDEKLLPLDKRALDEAYHAHLLLLFSVWLKDQAGDPSRFNTGLRTARRAYHTALTKIEQREQELDQQKREKQ